VFEKERESLCMCIYVCMYAHGLVYINIHGSRIALSASASGDCARVCMNVRVCAWVLLYISVVSFVCRFKRECVCVCVVSCVYMCESLVHVCMYVSVCVCAWSLVTHIYTRESRDAHCIVYTYIHNTYIHVQETHTYIHLYMYVCI